MRVNAVKGVHLFDCEVKELGCCTDVVALKKESLLKLQKMIRVTSTLICFQKFW